MEIKKKTPWSVLYREKVIFLAKKKIPSICRPESKFVSTTSIRTTQQMLLFFWTGAFTSLEGVHVKNLGSRLRPSIGSHTKIWAFGGFFFFTISG
jgi:hypothetical protein